VLEDSLERREIGMNVAHDGNAHARSTSLRGLAPRERDRIKLRRVNTVEGAL
jgi:hypothetical protein